jgi:hypothetical protein
MVSANSVTAPFSAASRFKTKSNGSSLLSAANFRQTSQRITFLISEETSFNELKAYSFLKSASSGFFLFLKLY